MIGDNDTEIIKKLTNENALLKEEIRDAKDWKIFDARNLSNLLCDVAQLLDSWHNDGTCWSEWDESVRKRVSEALKALKSLDSNDEGDKSEGIKLDSDDDLRTVSRQFLRLKEQNSRLKDAARKAISRIERCQCAGSDGHRINLKVVEEIKGLIKENV